MLIRPFEYADAARFWGADDPGLALLLHAVTGGTPAYRREFVAFDAPSSYSAAGFHDDLRAIRDPRLVLVTLDDIYA